MLTTALLRHLQIRVDYVTIEWPTENRRENNDETRRSEKKIVCHYEAAKKVRDASINQTRRRWTSCLGLTASLFEFLRYA